MKLPTQLLLFAIVSMILLGGCDKSEKYNPEEILATIDTDNWQDGYQGFAIIENKESVPVFSELTKGQECILKRGEEISGDRVNLHLLNILKDPQNELISWTLYSFLDINPGTKVDLYSVFNPPSRKASADAKVRFNSSVLAPFFESRACSGVHTI